MSAYKIDKRVPMPSNRHPLAKYPFAQMEVGDSIKVEPAVARNAAAAARKYANYHGKKFSTRKVSDKGHIRIWRVK